VTRVLHELGAADLRNPSFLRCALERRRQMKNRSAVARETKIDAEARKREVTHDAVDVTELRLFRALKLPARGRVEE
jgi:hypothetical protein